MNKVFIGLVLAVCLLGMALVMLNDRLGRSPDAAYTQPVATPRPASPGQMQIEADARAREIAEAASREETPAQPEPAQPPAPAPAAPVAAAPATSLDSPGASLPRLPQAVPVPPSPEPAPAPMPVPPPRTAPASELPPVTAKAAPPAPAPEPARQEAARNKADTQPGGRTIGKFVVYSRDKGATVRIGGDAKMEFSHMVLENPSRVAVDLAGEWKIPSLPGIPRNDLVEKVRVGHDGAKTRITIDMKEKPRRVTLVPARDGRGVDVRVDK